MEAQRLGCQAETEMGFDEMGDVQDTALPSRADLAWTV
jgi:hypothetical protein